MRTLSMAGAAALCLASACDPAGQATPAPSAQGTTTQAPSAALPSSAETRRAAEYRDEDLPVAADFEDGAEKEINEDNYLDKLEEIETELGGGAAQGADGGAGK